MREKIDLVYDLVSKIDERQRVKELADATRHANEDSWRHHVNLKLDEHGNMLKSADQRLDHLEADKKVWAWFKSRTAKGWALVTGVASTAYTLYRMIG